jgi:hypothetical protein
MTNMPFSLCSTAAAGAAFPMAGNDCSPAFDEATQLRISTVATRHKCSDIRLKRFGVAGDEPRNGFGSKHQREASGKSLTSPDEPRRKMRDNIIPIVEVEIEASHGDCRGTLVEAPVNAGHARHKLVLHEHHADETDPGIEDEPHSEDAQTDCGKCS